MSNDHHSFNVISDVSNDALEDIVTCGPLSQTLFPDRKLLIDYVPYECCRENISVLMGKNTKFYSSARTTFHGVRGLFSAGSSFRCKRPPESYTVDIFGTDHADLENHLIFHLVKAFGRTRGEFCLQIFVEKGYIAQKLCQILIKLGIPKCNWYVEGGISTKSVVKEDLN